MKISVRELARIAAGCFLLALAVTASAQVGNNPEGLTDPRLSATFTNLEQNSARANQAVYEALIAVGCTDQQGAAGGVCDGTTFEVFDEVRELVHTANELNGTGPTNFSLGLDSENLGFALRWTTGEEIAAISTSVRDFTSSQAASLASRLSSLRSAAGRRVAGYVDWRKDRLYASNDTPPPAEESIVEPWGAYIDSSFGFGDQEDTTGFGTGGQYADAFDFDNREVTIGSDYRLNDRLVLGILAGYTEKSVDFDSTESIVDARIEGAGSSVIGYGLLESGPWYATGSLGAQWLSFNIRRRITYPSFNPLIPPTDDTAFSSTRAKVLQFTLGGGYDWRAGALTIGPFLNGQYQDVQIDGFAEGSAFGFDLRFDDDSFNSLKATAGVRATYVLTPSFGILIPYLQAEFRKEFEDESRNISALYVGAEDVAGIDFGEDPDFAIPTDAPDGEFGLLSAGMSIVLPFGLQGFVQYQQAVSLEQISEQAMTGGLRFEF